MAFRSCQKALGLVQSAKQANPHPSLQDIGGAIYRIFVGSDLPSDNALSDERIEGRQSAAMLEKTRESFAFTGLEWTA